MRGLARGSCPTGEDGATLDAREVELVAHHASGRSVPVSVRLSRIVLHGRPLYTALVSDIGERRELLRRLRAMAERDATTGLYNRAHFQTALNEALAEPPAGLAVGLIYIDLDNFKRVNDTLGHAAGDALLVEVAELLRSLMDERATLARFGGDEFTALVRAATVEAVVDRAEAIRAAFERHAFRHDGRALDVGCSIGVATLAPDRRPCEGATLMAEADAACRLAKRAGRNRVRVHAPSDAPSLGSTELDTGWSRRIRRALAGEGFHLVGHPVTDVADGALVCHEVQLRLIDADGSHIMPNAFFPTAERLGLAGAIDRWVVSRAIERLVERRLVRPAARFALDVSVQSLGDADFAAFVAESLAAGDLEPDALTFQVTEAAAETDMPGVQRVFEALRSLGCRTALTAFGSNLCSFGYLRALPVDAVRIDDRLVRDVARSRLDLSIVDAINAVVHAGGMTSVAGGVHGAEAHATLAALGIDHARDRAAEPEPLDAGDEAAPPRAA